MTQQYWTTPWYDETQKPVREGVYEIEFGFSTPFFSHWNGYQWCPFAASIEAAHFYRGKRSCFQFPRWRGLTQPAK